MSAVSSSPANGSMCWVMKSGSTGGGRLLELDLGAHQDAGHILADRNQQPLEQQEGFLLILVDRLLLRVAPEVDDLAQARRASRDAPSSDDRGSGSGFASRPRSSARDRPGSSLSAIASSARFCSRSMMISCSTASSSSQSSSGGSRPKIASIALRQAGDVPLLGISALGADGRRRSPTTVSARMSLITSLTLSASMMSARCS